MECFVKMHPTRSSLDHIGLNGHITRLLPWYACLCYNLVWNKTLSCMSPVDAGVNSGVLCISIVTSDKCCLGLSFYSGISQDFRFSTG